MTVHTADDETHFAFTVSDRNDANQQVLRLCMLSLRLLPHLHGAVSRLCMCTSFLHVTQLDRILDGISSSPLVLGFMPSPGSTNIRMVTASLQPTASELQNCVWAAFIITAPCLVMLLHPIVQSNHIIPGSGSGQGTQLRSLRQQLLTFPAERVKYVVLDEADKMLSLGLQPQLKRIRAVLIPRKSKAAEAGVGTLVKPHTRRKRPQVLPIYSACSSTALCPMIWFVVWSSPGRICTL